MKAYKFITSEWKSKEGNISWELGKWNKHEGEIKLCSSGFHACKKPIDALKRAENKFNKEIK